MSDLHPDVVKVVISSLHDGLKGEGYDGYVPGDKVVKMAKHIVARLEHEGMLVEARVSPEARS